MPGKLAPNQPGGGSDGPSEIPADTSKPDALAGERSPDDEGGDPDGTQPGDNGLAARDPASLPAPRPPRRTITIVEHHPPPSPLAVDPIDRPFFIGGYGGIDMRLSGVSRKLGAFIGARGGILLGQRLSIGAAMYKLARRYGPPIRDSQGRAMNIKMAYGGATLGLTVVRTDRVELQAQALLGAGVGCVSYDANYKRDELDCYETVRMFVGEPGAVLFINLADWFRVGVDLGYRGVARERWRPPNEFNLSGGYGGLMLQFGWFARDDDPY